MSGHQPPAWWIELQQLPQEMTREQYEADAIAEANALHPDEEPAEDLG
jgi:hypothetical protein